MNKKGFNHWIRGVVHCQIRCTDFKSSKNPWIFFGFFEIFRFNSLTNPQELRLSLHVEMRTKAKKPHEKSWPKPTAKSLHSNWTWLPWNLFVQPLKNSNNAIHIFICWLTTQVLGSYLELCSVIFKKLSRSHDVSPLDNWRRTWDANRCQSLWPLPVDFVTSRHDQEVGTCSHCEPLFHSPHEYNIFLLKMSMKSHVF